MRILFTSMAVRSHLYQLAPLIWACRTAGHEVRVAAQPELTEATVGLGLPAVEVGHGYDMLKQLSNRQQAQRYKESLDSAVPVDERRRIQQESLRPLVETVTVMAPDLLRFAGRWEPDLVVTDPLMLAAPLLSQTLGVPLVRHLTGPDLLRRLCPVQGQPTTGAEREQWPPGLVELYDRYGVEVRDDHPVRTVDPWPGSLQLPDVVGRIPTRFVPHNGAAAAPDWLLEPPSRPRVCVTWGTTTTMLGADDTVLARVVGALAAGDVEVVLAVVRADRERLGPLPDNVRVADNVPINLYLESCGAVVNAGGAGSVLTAACYGVPQVMLPQASDTPAVAFNFSASGAGTMLDAATADTATIASAVDAALTDGKIRDAAERLREEIAATPSPADVVQVLEQLG
ncbi:MULTISPECIES: nucleotide disphospho-sugar-binding domain-containing protein [unclassified Micromonospora]|uniref:nucleotide disphospho-sugar-binding domain-containing protein n=1 Tax=unclassified Micromonospora TaxID=2617518 RepID=UPI0009C91A0C|nr:MULTISPECIES: nucleotide disphospho-sugar-binding domain-containing protein [unclassified Micromonospora]MDI5937452.1 DUF1205 domain-containing protein [Micromonospora sp. DH15]OON30928.1 hypothetical protein BSA16_13610 [Micromonospora sp. Rc5]